MLFAFTEDQLAIGDAVRRMLLETCTANDLRALEKGNESYDPKRLAAIREMGLFGMLSPQSCGGMGLAAADFAPIAEASGYVALPEPLIEHAGIAIPLLASLQDDRCQAAVNDNDGLIAIGSPLSPFVLNADSATQLVLTQGEDVHLLARDAVKLKRVESIDPLRRLFSVEWSPSPATRVGADVTMALDLGALWTAGQLLGLAQRGVDLAVAYAKQRVQFGKPIGAYQAVKHLLANAQVKIEFARPVFHAAAAERGTGLESRARVSHARLAAAQAAENAMRAALQVHGAMGYTWECDLHFFLKRALALGYSWGEAGYHRARIVDRLKTLPIGPDCTFASEMGSRD